MGIDAYRSDRRHFTMNDIQSELGNICDILKTNFNCDTFLFSVNPQSFSDWQEKLVNVFSKSKKWHSYLALYKKVYRDKIHGDLHYPAPYNTKLVLEILSESHFLNDWQNNLQINSYHIIKVDIDESVHQDYVGMPLNSKEIKNTPIPCPVLFITVVRS